MEKTDHDNLTTLIGSLADFKNGVNEKFADLKLDIKDLRYGLSTRVVNLEKTKADRTEIDAIQKKLNEDFEIRVRSLEAYKNNMMGRFVMIAFFMSALVSLIVLWIANLLEIKA